MSEQLGRYILDRKIAEGGMAEVFLARQSGPQGYERVCVVKRMLPLIADDHMMVQMFLDEARLAAQLTHPNIAQIYDFGEVRGTYFLAMEFIPGCSLRDLIDEHAARGDYLASPVVGRIVAEAATALDYAHSALGPNGTPLRVIHRDVSPQNILLSASGAVKLIDFGIAKANTARQETVAGTIKGKFAYMSPEQIRGDPLDGRSDIYALGLVLYELLTNARALDGSTEHALMEAVYFSRIVPPTMLRADIPLRLLEVLSRSIVRDADARYPSAGEMAQALDQFVTETGSTVSARQLAQLVVAPREGAKRPPKSPSMAQRPARKPTRESVLQPTAVRVVRDSGSEQTIVESPTDKQPMAAPISLPSTRLERRTPVPPDIRPTARDGKPALMKGDRSAPDTIPPDTAPDGKPHPEDVLPDTAPDGQPASASRIIGWLLTLRWRGRLVLVLLVALFAAAAVWALRRAVGASAGNHPRHALAILDFQNLAGRGESAWLATALSEMIGTELAAPSALRIIPGEEVARAQAELGLVGALDPSPESLARLRRNLGCDQVLSGAYLAGGEKAGGSLRVDLKLRRAPEGEILAALHETGSEGDLPAIVSRLGQHLRPQLGVSEPPSGNKSYPSTPEGTRYYADGLAALHKYDILGAQAALEKAVAASPNNPLPYAALASVWQQLGSDARAAEMARAALDRSQSLSREQKLEIEARNHEMAHDWTLAQNAYKTLLTFFPDDVDYGLGFARAQYKSGDGNGALATLDRLRFQLPKEDPRVDLEEARAAVTISDYKRGIQAARAAAAKAKAADASLLQAQALLWEGWSASYLGENARAIAALDEARALCEPLSDHACVARAMDWAGTVYSDQGDYPRASERLEAAVTLAKSCGDGSTEMGALNNLALVESSQGHLAHAAELEDQALAIATRLGDRRAQASMTDTKAGILASLAQPDAERLEEGVLKEFVALRDQGSTAMARMMLGKIALDQGDLARSKETLEASLKTLQDLKMQIGVVNALQALSAVREERDEAGEAKRLLDEEVRVGSQLGASAALATARVAEARLALAAGKAAEAVKSSAEAVGTLHESHAIDDEVAARLVEADALRALKQFVEAQQVLDAARPLADGSENPRSRLGWRIESALVQASTGSAPQSVDLIAQVVADARQLGLARVELQARLAQAEIELLAGHRKKGASQLQALSKDAAGRGFMRVARVASALGRD